MKVTGIAVTLLPPTPYLIGRAGIGPVETKGALVQISMQTAVDDYSTDRPRDPEDNFDLYRLRFGGRCAGGWVY